MSQKRHGERHGESERVRETATQIPTEKERVHIKRRTGIQRYRQRRKGSQTQTHRKTNEHRHRDRDRGRTDTK